MIEKKTKNVAPGVVIYFEILMYLRSTQNENEARRFLNAILTFLSTFSFTKCKIYIYIYIYIYMTWINNMANCFSGVRVIRSLVFYVCFVYNCLSFCTFPFGHCVFCSSSIYGFRLPLWYLQTLRDPQWTIMHVSTIEQIFWYQTCFSLNHMIASG